MSSFWWKWELENEFFEGIRNSILQGTVPDVNGVEVVADSSSLVRQKSQTTNQQRHSSFTELCWDLGTHELLKQDKLKRLSDYQLRLAGIQPKLKEESLLELTLACIKADLLKEALERLETYIPLVPYSENSKLIGYAGLISFALWKRDPAMMRYHRTSIECFQNAIRLDSHASSYFLKFLVRTMSIDGSDNDELIYFLESLTSKIGTDHFCLLELYKLYRQLDRPDSTWMPLAYQLCKSDPMIDVEILIELAETVFRDNHGFKIPHDDMMNLLATRIEYEKANLLVWRCIIQYNTLLSDQHIQMVWQDRVHFWPDYLALQAHPGEEMRALHRKWIDQVHSLTTAILEEK